MLRLGIDDAGKGPIIGPMILAGCLINEKTETEFRELGVKDSKQIAPKRREMLAKIIKEKAAGFKVILIQPSEITSTNHNGINLNHLEAQKAAEITNKLNNKKEKIVVYVDCPSPNISAWQKYLESKIENKENLEIHCEHKADVNYVSCSAASILAKSAREAEVEKIKKQIGKDFGSGYTSDPVTCKFLAEYAETHKKDGIFRETWSTWKHACKTKEQKKLGEF